jgi:hypothetical protein
VLLTLALEVNFLKLKTMATKISKNFEIIYPLRRRTVSDLKIVSDHLGDLIVTGKAYCDPTSLTTELHERISLDIDFVKFNGTDIKPVLEVGEQMEEIEEFCLRSLSKSFNTNKKETV